MTDPGKGAFTDRETAERARLIAQAKAAAAAAGGGQCLTGLHDMSVPQLRAHVADLTRYVRSRTEARGLDRRRTAESRERPRDQGRER